MSRDKTKLHPELQKIVAQFEDRCKRAGLNVLVTETYRTEGEQIALYAKGRTEPGNIVTNAKYPKSPHCWGVAFDFCRNVRGREYDDSDGFFKKCGEIGKSLGLAWGGDFKSFVDKPHLELKKYLPNNSVNTLIKQYGTPEKFIASWKSTPQEDSMTYDTYKRYEEQRQMELEHEKVPDWAAKELAEAVSFGITDRTFPMRPATRCETAIMVKRGVDAAKKYIDAENKALLNRIEELKKELEKYENDNK